ncbi:hypothetical protein A6A08_07310 [Nocardiopsis sp. TSRI0078]|nr:hypothetical protein A6A08_07310 [Nocardiopsis sp. TSRI0078]
MVSPIPVIGRGERNGCGTRRHGRHGRGGSLRHGAGHGSGLLESLFGVPFDRLLLILVSTVGIFATVLTYTRIAGLRSFSKMSSFDFAMTVAVGSLVATVAVAQVPLLEGMVCPAFF